MVSKVIKSIYKDIKADTYISALKDRSNLEKELSEKELKEYQEMISLEYT